LRTEKREAGRTKALTAVQKAAYFGVLSALALALSWAESFLAPLLNLPMGIKPGLSNIAVMVAGSTLGLPAGLAVAAAKAMFAGVTRGLTAMLLSAAGGLVSALLVGILLQINKNSAKRGATPQVSETGIGMLGGVTHNLCQLGAAALLTRTAGIYWLAPLLIVSGLLSGAVTGTLVKLLRKKVLDGFRLP